MGGAVAEWSKAQQLRKKINKNQKIPGMTPGVGNLLICSSSPVGFSYRLCLIFLP